MKEEEKAIRKFRGVKLVTMISVLEGNGVNDPYREVHYIHDGDKLVGEIDVAKITIDRIMAPRRVTGNIPPDDSAFTGEVRSVKIADMPPKEPKTKRGGGSFKGGPKG